MDSRREAELRRLILGADEQGAYDTEYCLNLLEYTLGVEDLTPPDLDGVAERLAEVLVQRPEDWRAFIAASKTDRLAWKTLQCLLADLRQREPGSVDAPPEALGQLQGWALDVAQGVRAEPRKRGRDRRENSLRDAVIAATVDAIRLHSDLPATSETSERSACHLIACRVHLSYDNVRRIWRRARPLLDRASEVG